MIPIVRMDYGAMEGNFATVGGNAFLVVLRIAMMEMNVHRIYVTKLSIGVSITKYLIAVIHPLTVMIPTHVQMMFVIMAIVVIQLLQTEHPVELLQIHVTGGSARMVAVHLL